MFLLSLIVSIIGWGVHISYSLNSLKGGYRGDYIGDYCRGYWGDTRSLDYNPHNPLHNPIYSSFHFIFHFLFHLILHY